MYFQTYSISVSAVYIGIVGAKIKTTLKWLKSYIIGELIELMLNNYFSTQSSSDFTNLIYLFLLFFYLLFI